MTFEAGVPAAHEVYFSITDSTRYRAPMMTLTHLGGVDIEEFDKRHIATVPFGSAHWPEGEAPRHQGDGWGRRPAPKGNCEVCATT